MKSTSIAFIPAAIAIIFDEETSSILLIKRHKPPFQNMWSLPGGKIESHEHVTESIIREINEECGIDCRLTKFLGVVSEIVFEDSCPARNHLLNIYEVKKIAGLENKSCAWFNITEIEKGMNIPPSDIMIVRKFIIERESNYYNCILTYDNGKYSLKRFDKI